MRTSSGYIALLAAALTAGIGNSAAQTAFWTGGGLDTDWNNGLNWDIGVPAEGTNAVIGAGSTVDYNAPMAATSFAGVNNSGILNLNAAGFNLARFLGGALTSRRVSGSTVFELILPGARVAAAV